MTKIRSIPIVLLIGSLLLTACATKPVQQADEVQSEIDRQILQVSQKVQLAQADLYQAGALNQVIDKLPSPILGNQKRIAIKWHGDVVQLLEKLANDRGLIFSSSGIRVPLPINIDVKDGSYEGVLNMLRTQVGYRAVIVQDTDKLVLQYNRPQS